jgi:DNA polymerase-4
MSTAAAGPRRILHVDMDAFFVSVELLDHPELRGTPVIVGGSGARGVVAAASYEARAYGVHSAMPSVTARRLCPAAVFLDGRHDRYRDVSRQVMAIFGRATPLVEPLSLDEAFLDVTGAVRAVGEAPAIARRIRADVLDELGLTCSVGVATTKFLAKLASERAKPAASPTGPVFGPGVFEVVPGGELDFLRPLPVQALWGVGRATLDKLARLGVATVGDLADLPASAVESALGAATGRHLHQLANGIDDRPVVVDQRAKSVSHEETFATDRHTLEDLDTDVVRLADAVAARLRAGGVVGRTVVVKVRFGDFRTITRSHTPGDPVDDGGVIARTARGLLAGVEVGAGVRLLGIGVTNLADTELAAEQLSLLATDEPDPLARRATNEAVDEIRARFGPDAIGPARLAGPRRVETFRPGRQQWGPSGDG